MKKLLIILGILVLVGGVVYLGYFLSSKNSSPASPEVGSLPPIEGGLPGGTNPTWGNNSTTTGGSPTGTAKGISLFSPQTLSSYGVASDTSVLGVGLDGKIYRLVLGGSATTLSDSPIDNYLGAKTSADGSKILVYWGDEATKQFSIFDVATKSWTPLQLGVIDAAWSPTGASLAYVVGKDTANVLYIYDLTIKKSMPKAALSLHIEDPLLSWPSKNRIFVSQRSSSFVKSSLWVYDILKKTFSVVSTERPGLLSAWNELGSEGLVFASKENGRGGSLGLINLAGASLNQLDFLTLPEKCVFAGGIQASSTASDPNILFCAIPRDQSAWKQNSLPDEYYKLALGSSDDIYRITLEEGRADALFADPNKSLDILSPRLVGNNYSFLNRNDHLLYYLPL